MMSRMNGAGAMLCVFMFICMYACGCAVCACKSQYVYGCVLAVRDVTPQEAEAPIAVVHAGVHVSEYRDAAIERVEATRSGAARRDAARRSRRRPRRLRR